MHISGPPYRWLACCTHGRSRARYPGMSIMRVDSRELPLSAISLSAASMSSLASQAHAFYWPVCQRLSWLHHWSIPHVHTSKASPSEWGPDPQCQAVQVAHWIWWWQCLAAWHCGSAKFPTGAVNPRIGTFFFVVTENQWLLLFSHAIKKTVPSSLVAHTEMPEQNGKKIKISSPKHVTHWGTFSEYSWRNKKNLLSGAMDLDVERTLGPIVQS